MTTLRFLTLACASACLCLLTLSLPATDTPTAPASVVPNLYDRATPALVEILVNDQLNGSGWIADATGLVVTAAHVVAGNNRRIEVVTNNTRLEATLVAVNLGHDLALLRLPKRDDDYPSLPLAKRTPAAGSDIFLFGAPLYRHAVMLKGNVARNTTTYEYLPDHRTYIEAVHVAAATPRGTSGGPWLSDAGEVVGLQSGMMHERDKPVGIAFVIPVEPIRFLINTRANASTPHIGAAVEEMSEQDADYIRRFPARTDGVVLRAPDSSGSAARAGLLDLDLITAVNDKPIRLRDQLLTAIRAQRPGDELTLTIMRANRTDKTNIKLKLDKMERP